MFKARKKAPKVNLRCLVRVGRSEVNDSKFEKRLYIVTARGRKVYRAWGPLEIKTGRVYAKWLQQVSEIHVRYVDAIERATTLVGQQKRKGYGSLTRRGPKPPVALAKDGLFTYETADGSMRSARLRAQHNCR